MVRKKLPDVVISGILVLTALFILSPVLIVCIRSFTNGLDAYIDFFVWKPAYLNAMCNSLLIALGSALGTIVVSVPAAYLFAKIPFRGRGFLFYLYIIVMMMPFSVTLLPQYIVSREIGLYDTLLSLILPGIFSPFAVFLLTQMMKSIPDELLEAARMETDSDIILMRYILVPMVRPGIICASVLVFSEYWNAVSEPLVLMETEAVYPLSVMLNVLSDGDILGFTATVLFCLAPMFLFSYFETEIMEGLGDYRLK